jgi:transposase
LIVDTLGLSLRVVVTADSVTEREGGKQVLKRVKDMGESVSRLHTIWVDGGFDEEPFVQWVMDACRWIVEVVLRPVNQRVCLSQKAVGGGAHFWMVDGMEKISQRL